MKKKYKRKGIISDSFINHGDWFLIEPFFWNHGVGSKGAPLLSRIILFC
jgi:hypothetical protein